MTTVPSPREVLTSIISTLSAFDPKDSNLENNHKGSSGNTLRPQPPAPAPGNPLKLIPNSHRALLTTLHVLYPSTLLPALDLLDRRLVTRVVVVSGSSRLAKEGNDPTGAAVEAKADHDDKHSDKDVASPATQQKSRSFYLVRSAQQHHQQGHSTRQRRTQPSAVVADPTAAGTGTMGGGGKSYVVRLDAWNCSCAAFAFSAFPPEPSSSTPHSAASAGTTTSTRSLTDKLRGARGGDNDAGPSTASGDRAEFHTPAYDIAPAAGGHDRRTDGRPAGEAKRTAGGYNLHTREPWEFGGLSFDGTVGSGISGVPCCKHLLACVLGERWSSVLEGYIEERRVGREEAAGLMSDT